MMKFVLGETFFMKIWNKLSSLKGISLPKCPIKKNDFTSISFIVDIYHHLKNGENHVFQLFLKAFQIYYLLSRYCQIIIMHYITHRPSFTIKF